MCFLTFIFLFLFYLSLSFSPFFSFFFINFFFPLPLSLTFPSPVAASSDGRPLFPAQYRIPHGRHHPAIEAETRRPSAAVVVLCHCLVPHIKCDPPSLLVASFLSSLSLSLSGCEARRWAAMAACSGRGGAADGRLRRAGPRPGETALSGAGEAASELGGVGEAALGGGRAGQGAVERPSPSVRERAMVVVPMP
jgi:hypothetical protein